MKKVIYSAALVSMLLLGACNDEGSYSPQEILNETLQESGELTSYYAEYKTELVGDGVFFSKQWQQDGKIRVETTGEDGLQSIALNDGQSVLSYTEAEKKAYRFSLADENGSYVQPTMREQAQSMLNAIKDTHEISIGEDAKIAGHDTYHLIAKAKEENSLMGDIEVWVDKKTWMVLKTTSKNMDMEMISEYTVFEPNAKIDPELFEVELPADVEIEENEVEPAAQITMDEAKQLLGAFLMLPEQDELALQNIEKLDLGESEEISFMYLMNENPAFTISVFKPAAPLAPVAEEEVTVRGQKGTLMDLDSFRVLTWDEGGLRYSVLFDDLTITTEQFMQLAENMTMTH